MSLSPLVGNYQCFWHPGHDRISAYFRNINLSGHVADNPIPYIFNPLFQNGIFPTPTPPRPGPAWRCIQHRRGHRARRRARAARAALGIGTAGPSGDVAHAHLPGWENVWFSDLPRQPGTMFLGCLERDVCVFLI